MDRDALEDELRNDISGVTDTPVVPVKPVRGDDA